MILLVSLSFLIIVSTHNTIAEDVSVCGILVPDDIPETTENPEAVNLLKAKEELCMKEDPWNYLTRTNTSIVHTPAQKKKLCHKMEVWRLRASFARMNSKIHHPEEDLTENQKAYFRKIANCRGKSCLTNLDIQPSKPAIRKEYRTLSNAERNEYHRAIQQLFTECIDGIPKYEILRRLHYPEYVPSAHDGAGFLPFHREYLKQYELALRLQNPNVSLHYWDSSLDQPLPNPVDSILWSDDFMGTSNGKVVSGPFAHWHASHDINTMAGFEFGSDFGPWLFRNLNTEKSKGGFYSKKIITDIMEKTGHVSQYKSGIDQLIACADDQNLLQGLKFENGNHAATHDAIGGHMDDLSTSADDPIFWMHHAFVDKIWEDYRIRHQSRTERETEYPTALCTEVYMPESRMHPFNLKNKDGLSNMYTDELYKYQASPICNEDGIGCDQPSSYLFCDNRSQNRDEWQCVAKVKQGGDCSGYEEVKDVCYKGTCQDGKCQ